MKLRLLVGLLTGRALVTLTEGAANDVYLVVIPKLLTSPPSRSTYI